MHFRGITTLRELQESVVTFDWRAESQWWRNLLRLKPLRLLLLTTLVVWTPSVALQCAAGCVAWMISAVPSCSWLVMNGSTCSFVKMTQRATHLWQGLTHYQHSLTLSQ